MLGTCVTAFACTPEASTVQSCSRVDFDGAIDLFARLVANILFDILFFRTDLLFSNMLHPVQDYQKPITQKKRSHVLTEGLTSGIGTYIVRLELLRRGR